MKKNINKLLINITWNSKDWKEESQDSSNHRWVKEGGIPGESLNFAKDARGNTDEHIFGYAKFTHKPKIEGSSIFIFYSQGKIVGFYGNAELVHKELDDNIILNLKGNQELSFVLENKINDAKALGFLEDKERVGMINFNYIEHNKTVLSILDEALRLNPNQNTEILRLKKWFIEMTNDKEKGAGYIDNLIKEYLKSCKETDWLDNELYKFEWAKWVNDKADFDTNDDATLLQLALDSHKVGYKGSTGVQFIKQGAREKMSKFIGIDDIGYFREFKEGKSLAEIGFEYRNMSYPIISCWLSVFFPERIYPVSRTSFADVVRKLFNVKVNNSNIAFIESLQNYCLQIDTKLKTNNEYQNILKEKLQLNELSQLEHNWAVQDFLLYLDRHPELFDKNITSSTQNDNNMKIDSLNQILYGPPGTGKTFQLQDKYFEKYTIRETNLTREQYIENLFNELNWFQVITLIVLELGSATVTQIMNHQFFPIKARTSSAKNLRAQVWGNLQAHTVEDCELVKYTRRVNPLIFQKHNNGNWSIVTTELEELFPEANEILNDLNNFQPSAQKQIKNYEFVTFHQSFSYEDFVEGIKPKLDDEESAQVSYEIKDGVFKKLALRAKADPDNNYAIFIDEINRGNVSAIFGELITLIEEDKRSNGKNPLKVKLPYSKTEFEVPSNLHIYGTMNTADRSVEALDTALRRRFSFKEIMPNPALLQEIVFEGFNLEEVLKTINERIEFLLDRDHTIGHSYFMNLESHDTISLKEIFKNKVIPLLQEYFYHDYEKIALILGPGFVKVTTNHKVKFPSFDGISPPDNVTLCELVDVDDIEEAIHKLFNSDGE